MDLQWDGFDQDLITFNHFDCSSEVYHELHYLRILERKNRKKEVQNSLSLLPKRSKGNFCLTDCKIATMQSNGPLIKGFTLSSLAKGIQEMSGKGKP
jgi:hypothetical protein